MFNHVLVPLDGSILAECVLPHVIAIARAFGSSVMLLRVADQTQGYDPGQSIDPLRWQLDKREANAYLESIEARLQPSGVDVQTVLLDGRAAEQISDFVEKEAIDLIILSSHGRSGLSGWSVSSIAQKILFGVSASVLIVRAYQLVSTPIDNLRYQRLFVPLDGSLRAESVLPMVTTLAQHYGAHTLIAHVVSKPEMVRRTLPNEEDISLAARVAERNREEIIGYLEQLSSRFATPLETRLIESHTPSAALHDLVELEGVDLVILSAHGYSGNTKWPYGSVVTNFIAYGATPLLIVQDAPAELTRAARTQAGEATPRPLTGTVDDAARETTTES